MALCSVAAVSRCSSRRDTGRDALVCEPCDSSLDLCVQGVAARRTRSAGACEVWEPQRLEAAKMALKSAPEKTIS